MRYRGPLVGVLVGVLLTAAYWFLLYQPRADEQAALQSETAELSAQQQQLRNEITALEEVQANEVEIRQALARLEAYIPSGLAQPSAIREFQQSADAAGVEITSVTFTEPEVVEEAPETGEENTALVAIPVTMVVEGGYFQAVDFFRRLEVQGLRAVLVDSVAIAEGEDEFPSLATTWSGQLFAVVAVPPEPAVTASPAPSPAQAGP
ncbi:MAG: type 4a pilus biogenesis protein PilO [Actinomycetota bacterium]|nr:type 4a pilus biogenesis protein PilO [Actinomycetota bacterium]